MSIERPSKERVGQFILMHELKKQTGNWYSGIPYAIATLTVTGIFTYSLYRSMTPTGMVPRILYEQSLPIYKRYTRHFVPWVFLVGTLFAWDVTQGVWDPIKK